MTVQAARLELARRSTVGMVSIRPRPASKPYVPARFHRALGSHCDAFLEACLAQRGPWHAYNAPPRQGKTEHVGIGLPSRGMLLKPGFSVLYMTSTAERARDVSRAVKSTIEMLHETYGIEHLAPGDKWTETDWVTVGGNSWVGVGVGASTGGIGANLVVFDDTTGNAERYRSRAIRKKTRRAIEEDGLSRLMSGGGALFMETRRGTEDTHAYVMQEYGHKITDLSWPLICDEAHLATNPAHDWRGLGEYLWPADAIDIRYGAEWHEQHPEVRGKLFAQLYQQRPTTESGGMLKRHWFADNRYPEHPRIKARSAGEVIITIDNAAGAEDGDWTRMQVWGHTGEFRFPLDQRSGRWGMPEQVRQAKRLFEDWPEVKFRGVEQSPPGMALVQTLRAEGYSCQYLEHKSKSKEVRAEALAVAAEAGRIQMPTSEHAPWVNGMIEEFAAFGPDCTHDDQVDAAAYAVAYFDRKTMQRAGFGKRLGAR